MTTAPLRYRTLAASLSQDIQAGIYPPGGQLPSVRELCQAHGASLATVVHALHRLEDSGLIEARPRQGFFVAADARRRPPQAASQALALDHRRARLMSLAASPPGLVSLSHLGLPPALLPLADLNRRAMAHLRQQPAALAEGHVYGSAALREQVALRAERRGCRLHAEDIVITQGMGESVELCLRLLSQVGDRVAVSSPASFRTLELLACHGRQVIELPVTSKAETLLQALNAELDGQGLAFCIFESAAGPSPTAAWSDADKQALSALLEQHKLPLLDCTLMAELPHRLSPPRPLKAFDTQDWVLDCGSLACVTGPGFSVGHIGSARYRLQLRAARAIHGELLPDLRDQVLADFMANGAMDKHLRRLRPRLRAQVQAYRQAVLDHFPPGTEVASGDSGHALWLSLPGGLDACALLDALRPLGYSFIPGPVFSRDSRFDHGLRLAASHPLSGAREAGLLALARLAREHLGAG